MPWRKTKGILNVSQGLANQSSSLCPLTWPSLLPSGTQITHSYETINNGQKGGLKVRSFPSYT
jgi:hypothetical protein